MPTRFAILCVAVCVLAAAAHAQSALVRRADHGGGGSIEFDPSVVAAPAEGIEATVQWLFPRGLAAGGHAEVRVDLLGAAVVRGAAGLRVRPGRAAAGLRFGPSTVLAPPSGQPAGHAAGPVVVRIPVSLVANASPPRDPVFVIEADLVDPVSGLPAGTRRAAVSAPLPLEPARVAAPAAASALPRPDRPAAPARDKPFVSKRPSEDPSPTVSVPIPESTRSMSLSLVAISLLALLVLSLRRAR